MFIILTCLVVCALSLEVAIMDNSVEGEVMGFFDFVELQVTMLF